MVCVCMKFAQSANIMAQGHSIIIMVGNSTRQKFHRTMSRSLDSDVLTQSWVLISEKR